MAAAPELVRYLCVFRHKLLDYRVAELQSSAEECGLDPEDSSTFNLELPEGGNPHSPFYYLTMPRGDALAQRLASRLLLTKGLYEIWGEGATFEDLVASVKQTNELPNSPIAPFQQPEWTGSWKFNLDCFGDKLSWAQGMVLFEGLGFLGIKGRVDLKRPDHQLVLVRCCPDNSGGLPEGIPTRFYLGRLVAQPDRSYVNRYALSKRKYLGPTSMDHEMAFLMCTMGHVRAGSFVLDPFVGTGSILVSAAHFGAITMGTDIDIRVVMMGKEDAKGGTLDVNSNFDHYGLARPALMRLDLHKHPLRATGGIFDAILGDPPYGVRAGGRKSEFVDRDISAEHREAHIPQTTAYRFGECLSDLLDLSSRYLRLGGRLVFFIPWADTVCVDSDLEPVRKHPFLKLKYMCDQLLNYKYSRRLVTMEKVAEFDEDIFRAYSAQHNLEGMAIDRQIHEYYYYDKGAEPEEDEGEEKEEPGPGDTNSKNKKSKSDGAHDGEPRAAGEGPGKNVRRGKGKGSQMPRNRGKLL